MFRDDTNMVGGYVAILRILMLVSYLFPIQTFAIVGSADQAATESENATLLGLNARLKTQSVGTKAKLQSATAGAPATGTATVASESKVVAAIETCETSRKAAYGLCAEWLNPDIATFVSENGAIAQLALGTASSVGEQCKGISDMASKAAILLGAFQAACGAAQATCAKLCGTATTALASYKAQTGVSAKEAFRMSELGNTAAPAAMATYTTAQAETAEIQTYLTKSTAFCGNFSKNVASALVGAVAALKGVAQAKACSDKNQNVTELDCTKDSSPNYATPSCQCFRGEKSAAECQAININASNLNPGGISLPRPSSASKDGAPGGPLDLGGEEDGPLGKIEPSAAGAPPPTGGGGGAGGGGGGGNGAGQDGTNAAKRLNTNILGGGFGGGGGGGSGGGGPGYGEMDSKLKDYMPGEKNDPNRTLASQLAKEVTPQAGRSNWEKVRLRYRDNYSSLLNK